MAGTARLFFAYWPDPLTRASVAERLAGLAGLPGRPVPAENFHVTLAFLGLQPEARLPALLEAGQSVAAAAEACVLQLDALDYWRGPRLWAAVCGGVPEPARRLHLALWLALEPLGLLPDARPWRPHLTLIRPARPATPPVWAPLAWPANRLVLAESRARPGGGGPVYQPLGEWVVP